MRQGCAVRLALACGCASAASTRQSFARPTLAEQVGFREIEIVPASFLPARDVAILNNVAAETVQREFADAIADAGRRLTGLRFSVSTRFACLECRRRAATFKAVRHFLCANPAVQQGCPYPQYSPDFERMIAFVQRLRGRLATSRW